MINDVTLREICKDAYHLAIHKGHYTPAPTLDALLDHLESEVKELRHAAKNEPVENFAEELADIFLLSASIAGFFGIRYADAIVKKHIKNQERPWKHGKEATNDNLN